MDVGPEAGFREDAIATDWARARSESSVGRRSNIQVLVTMDSERGAGRGVPVRMRCEVWEGEGERTWWWRRASERGCGAAKETRTGDGRWMQQCDKNENAEYVGGLLRWSSEQAATCAAICLHSLTKRFCWLRTRLATRETARASEERRTPPTWQSRLRQNSRPASQRSAISLRPSDWLVRASAN
jgi:hypothetical protein